MNKKSELKFSSKVTVVYEDLKQQIQSGRLAPGEMLPTTKELGEAFGVSNTTITQVMAKLAAENYIYRKRRKGTFVGTGNPLVSAPTRDIGFYLPMLKSEAVDFEPEESVWIDIFSGALAAAAALGYRLTAIPDLGGSMAENIERYRVNGVMLYGGGLRFPTFESFILSGLHRKMNYLVINREAEFNSINYLDEISSEDIAGVFREILASGHRRIGLIGCDLKLNIFTYRRHIQAYQNVMLEAGVYDPALMKRINSVGDERSLDPDAMTEQAIGELLALKEPPTLLVIFRSRYLDQTMRVLEKAGVRVPDDLQIVLIDNHYAGKTYAYGELKLSCYLLPSKFQFGETAVKNLIEIMEGSAALPVNTSLPLTYEPGDTWRRK